MNHTVSFEMAKRLKEAGWPQDLRFPMYDQRGKIFYRAMGTVDGWQTQYLPDAPGIVPPVIAAPILTELLEALPEALIHDQKRWKFVLDRGWYAGTWVFDYILEEDAENSLAFGRNDADNPCDAAAELWLWCKEKGYVK